MSLMHHLCTVSCSTNTFRELHLILLVWLSLFHSRYPQYVYPSAYLTTQGMLAAIPHSPLSPSPTGTTATQYIDYTSAYASQFATNGFEAYAPYTTTTAAGYGLPTAYTYAMPQQLTAAGASHFAHYQPQQIQERMQWANILVHGWFLVPVF